MKKRILFLMTLSATISFAQDEAEASYTRLKNSLGIDYRFESFNDQNIGLTYRRFNSSPYNLRANLNLGSSSFNQIGTLYLGNLLIYETFDSATPFIGVPSISYARSSYQKIELGVERILSVRNLNFIVGVDGTIGHYSTNRYHAVYSVEEVPVTQNGKTYSQYQIVNKDSSTFYSELNSIVEERNFLTLGVNLRLGFKLDLGNRFFATGFMNYNIESKFLVKESDKYKNEDYKEHIPSQATSSRFTSGNFYYTLGLNYRF